MRKAFLTALAAGLPLVMVQGLEAKGLEPAKIVRTAKGKAYADRRGMALYVFDKDAKDKSNCTGLCATYWPPLVASAGARPAGAWSVIARGDGSRQWAYEGRPLYTYREDTKPGEVTGDGAEGAWHLARP